MTNMQIAFAALCHKYGPLVGPLAPSLSGALLLWALGGNESSFGENTTPRFEPYYATDPNGGMPELMEKFGRAAAMSYGPLQMMFVNAPTDSKPEDFDDPDAAVMYSVAFLNKQLRRWRPITLHTIGQIWNGGSPMNAPGPGVVAYCAELERNYNVVMPVTI